MRNTVFVMLAAMLVLSPALSATAGTVSGILRDDAGRPIPFETVVRLYDSYSTLLDEVVVPAADSVYSLSWELSDVAPDVPLPGAGRVRVSACNVLGRRVFELETGEEHLPLVSRFSRLPTGIYFLHIEPPRGAARNIKVVNLDGRPSIPLLDLSKEASVRTRGNRQTSSLDENGSISVEVPGDPLHRYEELTAAIDLSLENQTLDLTVIKTPLLFADSLPDSLHASILWYGDHEDGDLSDWEGSDEVQYPGGGIFNTGGDDVIAALAPHMPFSGVSGIEATITGAWQAQNGNRAVRYMRWTDRAWDEGGDYFPDEAYYSVWMYFPYLYDPAKEEPWDPGDGGWWNVFQFKSNNLADESVPLVTFDVYVDTEMEQMVFGLISKYYPDPYDNDHVQTYYVQEDPIPIPVGQWFHVETYYEKSTDGEGSVRVWQDGQLIFEADELVTAFTEQTAWGIGNYTDHIDGGPEPGSATIYFDDAIVSTQRLSVVLQGRPGH